MLRVATLVFACAASVCHKPHDVKILERYNIIDGLIVNSTNAGSPTAFPNFITCKKPFVGTAKAQCSAAGGNYKLFGCSTLTYKEALLLNGVIVGFEHKGRKADSLFRELTKTTVHEIRFEKHFIQDVRQSYYRPPMESSCKQFCFDSRLCSSTYYREKEASCYIYISDEEDLRLLEDSIKEEIKKPLPPLAAKNFFDSLRSRFIPVAGQCNNTICTQCQFEGQRCRRGNINGVEDDKPTDERQCRRSAKDADTFTCDDFDKIIPECKDWVPAPETGCLCENILKTSIRAQPTYCEMGQLCTKDGCDDAPTPTTSTATTTSTTTRPTTTTSTSTTTVASPCPNSMTKDMLTCLDGTQCSVKVDEKWSCCKSRGGRMRCPANYPFMCAKAKRCLRDYCCRPCKARCDALDGLLLSCPVVAPETRRSATIV